MNQESFLQLKSCKSSYYVMSLIFGIPSLICISGVYQDRTFMIPTLLFLSGLVISYVWLSFFLIEVTEDGIYYRTLFGGTKSIRFDEIQRVQILFGWFKYSDRFKPMHRIAIEPNDTKKRVIYINMKVFSKNDLNSLFNILEQKLGDKCKF